MTNKRQLTPEEQEREQLKYEIAEEFGLMEKVQKEGWKALSAKETGRIGGIMTRRKREQERKKQGYE